MSATSSYYYFPDSGLSEEHLQRLTQSPAGIRGIEICTQSTNLSIYIFKERPVEMTGMHALIIWSVSL